MQLLNGLFSVPAKRMASSIRRLRLHVARCLLAEQYEVTPSGLIVRGGIRWRGEFHHQVGNHGPVAIDHNLLVDQGTNKILAIALGADAKLPAFYLALTSGLAPPTHDLTAASFAATMNEITSTTEGYTGATRPQWAAGQPAAGVIGNIGNEAVFNMVTSASVRVTGAGLISDSARGGTAGTLIAATLFQNPRDFFNADTFKLGYTVSLTD